MSMALSLGVMGFAVYAAATQTLVVNNTVNFVSNHVLASIVGDMEEATGDDMNAHYEGTVGADSPEDSFAPWNIGDVEFAEQDTDITIRIVITNLSKQRSLSFELVQTLHDSWNGDLGTTNVTRTVNYATTNTPETNGEYHEGEVLVQPEQVATIVITLAITDTGKSVDQFDNSFTLTLRNVETYNAPEGGFVFDGAENSILVPQGTTLAESNLPEMTDETNPAYYGLYEDKNFVNKVTLPYQGKGNEVYARFDIVSEFLEFREINDGNEYEVVQAGNPVGHIDIPEKYNGKVITRLGQVYVDDFPYGAFDGASGITSMTLPDTITDLGVYAFYETTNLTSINIPKKVTEIKEFAFYRTGLTSLTLPKGLTRIAERAFYLPQFESLTIPNTVTYIGRLAFAGHNSDDSSLSGYYDMPHKISRYADVFSIESSKLEFLNFESNSKLEKIDLAAFQHSKISSVQIPASVKTIAAFAFANLAFQNYGSETVISERYLQSVTFEENSQIEVIWEGAFLHSLMTELVLPEGLKVIANSHMPDLEQIYIPQSVVYIHHGMYPNELQLFSSKLTSLNIPNALFYFSNKNNVNANLTSLSMQNIDEIYTGGSASTLNIMNAAVYGNSGVPVLSYINTEWLGARPELILQDFAKISSGENLTTLTGLSASKTLQENFVSYAKNIAQAKTDTPLTLKVDAEVVSAYENHVDLAPLIASGKLIVLPA